MPPQRKENCITRQSKPLAAYSTKTSDILITHYSALKVAFKSFLFQAKKLKNDWRAIRQAKRSKSVLLVLSVGHHNQKARKKILQCFKILPRK